MTKNQSINAYENLTSRKLNIAKLSTYKNAFPKHSDLINLCELRSNQTINLRKIEFKKLSLTRIIDYLKDGHLIYNLSPKNSSGLVVGIIKKTKNNMEDLLIASPSIIRFPSNSCGLLSTQNKAFNLNFLENITFENIDTSLVTDMSCLFLGLENIEYIDLSSFDTTNVTLMYSMFEECSNLKEIKLTNFNISNVVDFSYMFYNCLLLKNLDLSTFHNEKETNYECMFYNCTSLECLILKNIIIDNSPCIYKMLANCIHLKYIDMSSIHEKIIIEKEGEYYLFQCLPIKAEIKLKGYVD